MSNSTHFIGTVAKLYSRTGTSAKSGKPWVSHSFKLRLSNGQWADPFFRIANAPTFAEGDGIEFDAEPVQGNDQAMTVVMASLKPVQKQEPAKKEEAPATAKPAATKSAGRTSAGRDGYWEAKEQRDIEYTQPRISYQSARKDAIAIVQVLSDNKALPISEAAGKAGTAKRYEQVMDIINKLTVQLHRDTDTLRLLDSVADAGAVKVSKPAGLPDDADDSGDASGDSDGGDWE